MISVGDIVKVTHVGHVYSNYRGILFNSKYEKYFTPGSLPVEEKKAYEVVEILQHDVFDRECLIIKNGIDVFIIDERGVDVIETTK